MLQPETPNAPDAEALTAERAAELLRLAVPLMSRHDVPATPQNYAIWYAYVSGEKPALIAEIDRLVAEGVRFTEELNSKIYREMIVEHDVDKIERVRQELYGILRDVGSTLSQAGNEADSFGQSLGGIANQVDQRAELSDIRKLLETLLTETRSMQEATCLMQAHFEVKSREIEDLQQQLQEEKKRAVTDPLTGLCNRMALLDQLNASVGEMQERVPPSLIMLDIDHFKSVNDTHGHLIGDRVIRFVAQVLQKNIKGKDTAARYGGEEFTLLLPSTPENGAVAVAEAIRRAVSQAQLVRADNKKPLGQITISAGVATYRDGEDPMELLDRADRALYQAKNQGRNQVCTS